MNQVTFQTETVSEPAETSHPSPVPDTTTKKQPAASAHQLSVHPPMKKNSTKNNSIKNLLIALVTVFLGIGSGYLLYSSTHAQTPTSLPATASPSSSDQVQKGELYGADNAEAFKDEAEGVLVKGGIDGEGTHHIIRDGGPSRNVYLTSSVLDLNLFNDHKVKVWGETFQAQKAGWLMDVGRVEVIELNAEKPFEETSE